MKQWQLSRLLDAATFLQEQAPGHVERNLATMLKGSLEKRIKNEKENDEREQGTSSG